MRFRVKEIYFKVALRETSEGQGKKDLEGTKRSLGSAQVPWRGAQPAPTGVLEGKSGLEKAQPKAGELGSHSATSSSESCPVPTGPLE